jgi:hypothetical protein
MIGAGNLQRLAAGSIVLAGLFAAGRARAETAVSIHYEAAEQLELARRVASELASEGYAVSVSARSEPSPCDENGPKLVSVPRGTRAWIRLATDPANPDQVVASICYLGALPFLQQAAPSAPRAEERVLALATAEALNGLRSKLPPLEAAPEAPAPRPEPPPPAREPAKEPAPPASNLGNSASLGMAAVWNLPDFPALLGVSARATLGIAPSLGLAIDAFVPASGRDIASDTLTATIRTAFVRVGPRVHGEVGDFDVSGAVLAGPALTWATAVAAPPRVGTTDVTTGALLTLSASLEYPRSGAIYACASGAASALLPGVEVNLADGEPPRGAFPVEASIGFGARWGTAP